MNFTVYDFNEYTGFLYLTTEDYEHDFCADVDDCYSYDTDQWDDDAVRLSAEKQLREQFGDNAKILW